MSRRRTRTDDLTQRIWNEKFSRAEVIAAIEQAGSVREAAPVLKCQVETIKRYCDKYIEVSAALANAAAAGQDAVRRAIEKRRRNGTR